MMGETVFSPEQYQHIYPDGIENHYWNHARNAILFRFICKHGLADNAMLEIGSGRGIVVKYLHEKGILCAGVELAAVTPVSGVGNYFFAGTDAFELPDEIRKKFSVILLLDVIEHIENPPAFLERIVQAFPKVDKILLTVPARQELWTNYDTFNGHYKRYSLFDIHELATGSIKFSRGGYFNHILYPVFLLYARLFGQRETLLKAPIGLQRVVHRLLSFVLQSDYRLIPGAWSGTSAIALYSVNRGY